MPGLAQLIRCLKKGLAGVQKEALLDEDLLKEAIWLAQYYAPTVSAATAQNGADSSPPAFKTRKQTERETKQPPPQPPGSAGRGQDFGGGEQPSAEKLYSGAGGAGINRATPVYVPASGALQQKLSLTQALRPFSRRRLSTRSRVLDEAATAELYAVRGFLLPVFRGSRERWFSLALVLDGHPAMQMWHRTADQLQRLLEDYGGFRDVHFWRLTPDLRLLTKAGTAIQPRQLTDPTGRTIILFLTMGAGKHWTTRPLIELLTSWARLTPVAICSLLPETRWTHTDLGSATKWVLAPSPGVSNRQLIVGEGRQPLASQPAATSFPAFTLSKDAIAQWAKMQMAQRKTRLRAVLLSPEWFADSAPEQAHDRSDEDRIQQFASMASPEATRLLHYLSAVPLTLPIMQLVQETMMPESRAYILSEVLMSGLVRPIEHSPAASPDEIIYRFTAQARRLLFETLQWDELAKIADSVFEALRRYIERKAGISIDDFQAWIMNSAGDTTLDDTLKHFTSISYETLKALGYVPQKESVSPKEDFLSATILLMTVTKIETQMVMNVFKKDSGQEIRTFEANGLIYFDLGRINQTRVYLTRAQIGLGGPVTAAQAVSASIAAVHPYAVIMVGLAFGLERQTQRLGDILVATAVHSYKGQKKTERSKSSFGLDNEVFMSPSWLIDRFRNADVLWKGPKVHWGTMVNVDFLVADPGLLRRIRESHRKAIGGDMEGAELYRACHAEGVDCCMVKGIADWGEGRKIDRAKTAEIAATNAANFVLHVLQFAPFRPKPPRPGFRSPEELRKYPLPQTDAEDTQKGRWGGRAYADGRQIMASVTRHKKEEYYVDLRVASVDGSQLKGPVHFYLHESFPRTKITIRKCDPDAVLDEVQAYEEFTVGVQVLRSDGLTTALELDLSDAFRDADVLASPRLSHASEPGYTSWIFQSNPEYFDLRRALRSRRTFTWKLDANAKSIKVGDHVFMWQSKKDSGLLSEMKVIEGPREMPLAGSEFNLKPPPPAFEGLRVLMSVETVFQSPLSIEAFKKNPVLKKMKFIKMRLPMQRRLKPLEAAAIRRLMYFQPLG